MTARAWRADLEQPIVDLLPGADVDALGRLVEQDQQRVELQPFAQHQLLLVAAREFRGRLSGAVGLDRESGCISLRCVVAELGWFSSALPHPEAAAWHSRSATVRRDAVPLPVGRDEHDAAPPSHPAGRSPARSSRVPSSLQVPEGACPRPPAGYGTSS